MNRRIHAGFTLIEVMIVVVIVAILASIAYPSYTSYVQKARRADAMDALMYIQNLQEKWRASNAQYGSLEDIGYPGATGNSGESNDGYYNITVSGASATTYTATATGAGPQASDTECATLSIEVSATSPRGEKQSTGGGNCWRN